METSHKTARTRSELSAPMRDIVPELKKEWRILEYGCGKGSDARFLQEAGFQVEPYDAYYQSEMPEGLFDAVTCIYVLNTLYEEEQVEAMAEIDSKLKKGGWALVAVRRDVKEGHHTRTGTWQCPVYLCEKVLVERSGSYCIYAWRKK